MFILKAPTFAEFTVKNSRFIAEVAFVDTPEGAKEIWRVCKAQYDNGNHIVYAFITGPQGNIMGCSNDGEPAGTAGRPTLAVLKGSGLTNVIVTAARWFGGTKLGTGGLVRAYSDCARLALEKPMSDKGRWFLGKGKTSFHEKRGFPLPQTPTLYKKSEVF